MALGSCDVSKNAPMISHSSPSSSAAIVVAQEHPLTFEFSPMVIFWVKVDHGKFFEEIYKHVRFFCQYVQRAADGGDYEDPRLEDEAESELGVEEDENGEIRESDISGNGTKEGFSVPGKCSIYWLKRVLLSNYLEAFAMMEGLTFGRQMSELREFVSAHLRSKRTVTYTDTASSIGCARRSALGARFLRFSIRERARGKGGVQAAKPSHARREG
jgi:hypothetical protein